MKYFFLIACVLFVGCQTSKHVCRCPHTNTAALAAQIESNEKIDTRYLSAVEKLKLASELLNNDASEQALEILNSIPQNEQDARFKKLRRDAIYKTVVNLRYKIRMLYQQSLQQTGQSKTDSLKQSKAILEDIIKKYPDYNDMYSIKNNLKQIERELARKS